MHCHLVLREPLHGITSRSDEVNQNCKSFTAAGSTENMITIALSGIGDKNRNQLSKDQLSKRTIFPLMKNDLQLKAYHGFKAQFTTLLVEEIRLKRRSLFKSPL